MTEEEMLQRLEQSRESSKKGNYRNADDVISDMRGKHGLFQILRNGLIMGQMRRNKKRAEVAFEFNEKLDEIDVKLILFEKILLYNQQAQGIPSGSFLIFLEN